MKDRRMWVCPTALDLLLMRVRRVIYLALQFNMPIELAVWHYLEIDWGFTPEEAREFVENRITKTYPYLAV